jgi:hypothetical protein
MANGGVMVPIEHSVVIVTFDERGAAQAAYAVLGSIADQGHVRVSSAVVIERDESGCLRAASGSEGLASAAVGCAVGMLIGWAGDRSAPRMLPPWKSALVVELEETNADFVDAALAGSGGDMMRCRADELRAELEAAEIAFTAEAKAYRARRAD